METADALEAKKKLFCDMLELDMDVINFLGLLYGVISCMVISVINGKAY